MNDESRELLSGTLEMLVLKTLALEPMHGWGIAHRIEQMSSNVFLVAQGSLYPALLRMKRREGKQLDAEHASWHRAARAIDAIMNAKFSLGDA